MQIWKQQKWMESPHHDSETRVSVCVLYARVIG